MLSAQQDQLNRQAQQLAMLTTALQSVSAPSAPSFAAMSAVGLEETQAHPGKRPRADGNLDDLDADVDGTNETEAIYKKVIGDKLPAVLAGNVKSMHNELSVNIKKLLKAREILRDVEQEITELANGNIRNPSVRSF